MATDVFPYFFNLTPPKPVGDNSFFFSQEQIAGLPFLKYVPYETGYGLCPSWFQSFLDKFPVLSGFKYCLLDVKPRPLNKGEMPCIPDWHIDIVDNPSKNSDTDVHFLYTLGCGCPTLFLKSPTLINLPAPPLSAIPAINRSLKDPEAAAIEEGRIYTFTRNHLHKCQPAQFSGWRLLVRKTYTNEMRKGWVK